MGRGIIKIKDRYFEWSTVVDAPVMPGMTEDDLRAYIKDEYGNKGLESLGARIERCDERGTSFHGETLESVLDLNRAGEGETELTADKIYEEYCVGLR